MTGQGISRRDVGAAAVLAAGAGLLRRDGNVIAPPTPGGGLIFSTVIVRLYRTGPEIHENSVHAQLGNVSVRINDGGNLEITRDAAGGAIAYVAATVDETLAACGIIAGASGGLGKTIVRLYDTRAGMLRRPDSRVLASPTSNLWILWIEYPPAAS